ncbi:MAG: hypothetical protein K0U47_05075 [Epsilonproteobacteria bacterium]|nr:hypothetical protein [Campylobacterota bacterium]
MLKLSGIVFVVLLFMLQGCGDSSDVNSNPSSGSTDEKYELSYKGLKFFSQDLPHSAYRLEQLSDKDFNGLSEENKLIVADKLLSTLFFGYPLAELKDKIDSGSFISGVQEGLRVDKNDLSAVEAYIVDEKYFTRPDYANKEVLDILTRLYALEHLDRHFLIDWSAYILTQTIMFSPAYELESSHEPNTERVYNRLVRNLEEEATMRYVTYLHMISSDNWRRFRSPEDNGREMMEIYLLDFDDAKVPLAGKTLQNWKLDRDNDTLVVGLNENTIPISLFNTTLYNGDDFYRELAKSDAFTQGVVERLVDFFLTTHTVSEKERIADKLVASKPETWQDILVQIVFSKAFLLESDRSKSAEELFYAMVRKVEYKHYQRTFTNFASALEDMHQASMKYKLGKLERVPLDTLSFINYHKFIREQVLIKKVNSDKLNNYKDWGSYGWKPSFIEEENFTLDQNDPKVSLHSFINHLFKSTISREATTIELKLFEDHMLETIDGKLEYVNAFDLLTDQKANVAILVLDYISRLTELYRFQKLSL